MNLNQGEQQEHRIGAHRVTFTRAAGTAFDIGAGELITRLQAGIDLEAGTRVRVDMHDDTGASFQVWMIVSTAAARNAEIDLEGGP